MGTNQTRKHSLLAFFAHPDDETFRVGGMLTLLAQQGVSVQIVTATRGEAGISGEKRFSNPEELAAIRESELRNACKTLKINPPIILNYADGHLSDTAPGKFCNEFLSITNEYQPQVMLSFGPDGLSGHPDHIVIGGCVDDVFLNYQKAAALYHVAVPKSIKQLLGMNQIIPVPDQQVTLTLDVRTVWKTKMKAIRCHASQLSSSPILSQSKERQLKFLGIEHYVRFLVPNPDKDFIPGLLKGYLK